MKSDYQIWNNLHDGGLEDIQGDVPGDISITVDIAYLANKLPGNHETISVLLKNCTLFEYERYWTKDETQYYSSIEELRDIEPGLEALSAEEQDGVLSIIDICGTIRTRYDVAQLFLQDGRQISFEDLNNASREYWDNFGAKSST
ncbi:hypothetical protein EDC56_1770 [Sinobacterium caligoides]|uniref:Uncharacterized protein n=1 Tax=Sinobacterium caligoides TaxID=933926 RepID=A0A3N2DPU4_9GAMM|nr:hypothetical protein [Sinobacterium caligoides]ROS01335.1 hypothetical protein EDC56_1770 [Sinobacterium caligoides]